MPLPALAVPLATAGISALGGLLGNWLGGRSRRHDVSRPQYPMGAQQMGMPFGGAPFGGVPFGGDMMTQQIPGAGTLLRTGRFMPEQQAALSQMLGRGLGGLGALQQADFAPIQRAAETQFREQTVPGIAERFTGAGAQESGAFQQAMGGAAAGLQERLAAMKQQFGMQQRGQEQQLLLSLLQAGLAPQFETAMIPGGPGFMGPLAGGLGQGLGMLLPLLLSQYFGGGAPSGSGFGGAGLGAGGGL